jgi:putative hydrolase of the HAD superfamily
VRGILLDALGTLVALEPPGPRLRVELSRVGIEVSEEQAAAGIAAEIAYYRAHLDEGRDRDSLAALRARSADALLAALPTEAVHCRIDRGAMTQVLLASLQFRTFEDVEPALTAWRRRGLRLVVASNWDVSLHEVLDRLGIAPLLDAIVTSAEVGARKPATAVFERALALAGCEAREAVHVGDSPSEDVAGALAAGIAPVLIARDAVASSLRGPAVPSGVPTIHSLGELDAGALT